ncbi:LacI family DNA-binding transcriptional regulator [Pusillimonas sp. SM2304]|uniref:LacI family DNA-binding transcriptional regulator n=1 Tax=Pusillimonas sp. SM2304 TaxID=3073241 RepID=UPI0028744A5C|nr:LacI family DNA-binding transcriptional regulator [Pusillimonas sp. SM2304]MDS1142195.1 LacI family DNA-binding transcriptional regulator [Pusillimonas sp. SM2304]
MARPYAEPGTGAMRSVSIAQVAEHAGVSVATVSRVLNGKQAVKEQTRLRVAESVQAMGYRVNQLARSLRTDESRLLLIMVPDIGNPFYAQIVQGINGVVQDKGYSVLLCETGGDANRERRYFDLLSSRRADGAICLDPYTVQQALHGEALHFPWVACCEFDRRADVPYVGIDNRAAARDAVSYLIGKGHTRIAFVNSDIRFMYARERLQGYADALAQAGIALNADYCLCADSLDFAAGKAAAGTLAALDQRPTAVFAVSDTLAIGMLRGLREAGLHVPGDMAVMGFDDIALAQQTYPALSTVAQPMRTLGEQAAYALLKQLDDPRTRAAGVLLPHKLVLRESA